LWKERDNNTSYRLQASGAAKRRDRESHEEQTHNHDHGNKPMREIASPRAEGTIEPAQRKHRENGTNYFMKQLSQHAPEPPETPRFIRTSNWP
jgi:hypothetical protein